MTTWYDHLDAEARMILSRQPAMTYGDACIEAERDLTARGVTRGANMPVARISTAMAARKRADHLLLTQTRWERAGDSSITEAEAMDRAHTALLASNAEYAAVMGRR